MAECRDFFDEPNSAICRSSSFVDRPSPSEDVEEMDEHCLELTLGPGTTVGASCPLQVRRASAYNCLSEQPRDSFTSLASFVPTSELAQILLTSKDSSKCLQNFSGETEATELSKQHRENFAFTGAHVLPNLGRQADMGLALKSLLPPGDTAFQSRDQIWLKLQRDGAVLGLDAQDPDEVSSMWGNRSASMHVMITDKDVGDAENNPIRRSSSSGVLSLTASRQLSSIDSSLEKSPQKNMVYSHEHDQDALEDVRKRKELQAQRRQVARKRRRIATEEKQHKKSKQGSIFQGSGSRQSVSPYDKLPLSGAHASDGVYHQESHCTSPDAFEHECWRNSMQMIESLHAEETKQDILSQCMKEDKADMQAGSVDEVEGASPFMQSEGGVFMNEYNATHGVSLKGGALVQLSHEHNSGSNGSLMTAEFEQPVSVGNKFLDTSSDHNYGSSLHNSHAMVALSGRSRANVIEDGVGKCCETECMESSSIQNNGKLLGCTPEEGAPMVMGSSAMSTGPFSSNPVSYPAFPFLAVPYSYTIAAATTPAIPMQAGFPFPFLVPYPSHSDSSLSPLCGINPTFSGVTPGIALQGKLMSNESTASKDCMEESFEGKGSCGEKPAFAPLSRTASNLRHVKEEQQFLGGQLESQVTLPTSQLSSISSLVSDACNTKSLLLESQQSMASAGRLLSESSNTQDQSTLGSKLEGPALIQRGVDTRHGTSTLKGDLKVKVKQVGRVQTEERNVESQLGSEHLGVNASYVHLGSVERQKSGSFLDLPWVTTTGKGPNGKTINGVLYIADGRHASLVCSCHGKHMSPAEFVEHSGSSDLANPERSIVVCPVPSTNHHTASPTV